MRNPLAENDWMVDERRYAAPDNLTGDVQLGDKGATHGDFRC
jgi:hypothetical protein